MGPPPVDRAEALFGLVLDCVTMSMEHVLQLLKESQEIRQIRDALDRGSRGIRVEGLAAAAKSLFAAAIRGVWNRPMLLVTYNYEQAERLYEDMAALGIGNGDLLLLPPADSMIYQEGDTDLDVISRRLSALTNLTDGKPVVVVAPIAAVLQRTLPPETLAAHRMRVEKSRDLDLEECALRLVELGYERVQMVERQGEFSRRGGILDIFPSTKESPVRIELFGDEVESIRSFDVETQRSAGDEDFVDIAPAREILLDAERASAAADTLSELLEVQAAGLEKRSDADAAGKLRRKVEGDVLHIRNQSYFDGVEYYFPAVYTQECSLLDYCLLYTSPSPRDRS